MNSCLDHLRGALFPLTCGDTKGIRAITTVGQATQRRFLGPMSREPSIHDTFTDVKAYGKAETVVQLDRCAVECVEDARVTDVIARLPSEQVSHELAETFSVLADAGRVRLILALLEAGELCVCDLAITTGLSQTACSHNLRLLRAHRLVRYRKQGRNVYYALDDAHIRLLLDVALAHVGHGSEAPVLAPAPVLPAAE